MIFSKTNYLFSNTNSANKAILMYHLPLVVLVSTYMSLSGSVWETQVITGNRTNCDKAGRGLTSWVGSGSHPQHFLPPGLEDIKKIFRHKSVLYKIPISLADSFSKKSQFTWPQGGQKLLKKHALRQSYECCNKENLKLLAATSNMWLKLNNRGRAVFNRASGQRLGIRLNKPGCSCLSLSVSLFPKYNHPPPPLHPAYTVVHSQTCTNKHTQTHTNFNHSLFW